ncbi:MAG: tRNA pseudouridine32 synthase/23S rRNA pseudouridine746 synthase [Cyclobacteriaceae bacterium]
MDNPFIFNFDTDISRVPIPEQLNNPFGVSMPEIVRIAAEEFQDFITSAAPAWTHDFQHQKGKMFGVLVVQQPDGSYCYIGTVSGKLSGTTICNQFVPSVFDESVGDYFIDKGMTELTDIGNTIKQTHDQAEIIALKAHRKQKSLGLQDRLFSNYHFLNSLGMEQNVLHIFEQFSDSKPPSAAGDCAAPKLLHYAFKHQLTPIALAEFWWGNPPQNKERVHKSYYPACENKCRPILEYMLDDNGLFDQARRPLETD